MKTINLFFISSLLMCALSIPLKAQVMISANAGYNYWQHSEVFGPSIGMGLKKQNKRLSFSLNYDFGYGTSDRLGTIDNIDYDIWATVMTNQPKGKWNYYLGIVEEYSNQLNVSSDYGKQHQVTLQLEYNLMQLKGANIITKVGYFAALVEQFFTFTNVPIEYVELLPFYRGPLNYIPSASQKIATQGLNLELAAEFSKQRNSYSPYLSVGIGPKYSSYASLGIRVSTMLKKKTKSK